MEAFNQEIAEWLEAYKNGSISKENRFALEKLALDDDFLFDALHGFSEYQQTAATTKQEAKVFSFRNIAAAASIVLVAGFFLMNYFNNDQHSSDAQPVLAENTAKAEGGEVNTTAEVAEAESAPEGSDNSDNTILPPENTTVITKATPIESATKKRKETIVAESEKTSAPSREQEPKAIVSNVDSDKDLAGAGTPARPKVQVLDRSQATSNTQDEEAVGTSNTPAARKAFSLQESDLVVADEAMALRPQFVSEPVIGLKKFEEAITANMFIRKYERNGTSITANFTVLPNGEIKDLKFSGDDCSICQTILQKAFNEAGKWTADPNGKAVAASYAARF